MDRRPSRVINPKVRHVGFHAPDNPPSPPPPLPAAETPPDNSLSPVMIPPPRHVPVPRRANNVVAAEDFTVGSYNPSDSLLATSPGGGTSVGECIIGEFSEESLNWSKSKGPAVVAASSSLPSKVLNDVKNGGRVADGPVESNSKPLKEKTTKAERRALQEAQRAAKASGKVESKKASSTSKIPASGHNEMTKSVKQPTQKKDGPSLAPSTIVPEKKGGDRSSEKDKKKDVPPPRMQFDDKNRVEKSRRHAIVNQTEARNRVELFRHLPQYEYGTQLPDLESKFFHLGTLHPAVYKVGLQYLSRDITGSNARCVAMLQAFQEAIRDYTTPPEKTIVRDLTAKINGFVSFLIECRPLSVSMGNAIRFVKARIANIPLNLSESESKTLLCSDIDRFISDKIVLADKNIVRHAVTKIRNGDVLLTYGSPFLVETILLQAHEMRKQFRVVIVDSHPNLEGQEMLRRLVREGVSCSYTHINAVSYIMHEVTRVLLGAASVLSNGNVYSTVGTACVAMVAHEFRVPVLICCETYKFHERVQIDSICCNELGDPNAISKVPGRPDICYLDDWDSKENLKLLNLLYDVTPSDYVSMIITEYGMIPATSVPVIVREFGKENLST